MDYRSEILTMLAAITSQSSLKKIYKFVRMFYRAEGGGAD